MAALPNAEEDFEHVERHLEPNKLLKQYEALQCELEMEYEVLTVAELFEDDESEENKKQDKRLEDIEGNCWSDHAKKIIEYTRDGGKYNILSKLLDYGLGRVKSCDTNMKLAACFVFSKNGDVAMINYKRLAHTPLEEVSWTEINLALVEATALLCILSDKIEVKFKKYFPVPHDSKSFIIALSDQRILPLFGEGEFSKFKNKEFDDALVAFLYCISQLNEATKKVTPHQGIPHEIVDDKLIDPIPEREYTVRLQEAHNFSRWTRAMMFMLTNLKWLQKWVTLYMHKLEPFPCPNFEAILNRLNK